MLNSTLATLHSNCLIQFKTGGKIPAPIHLSQPSVALLVETADRLPAGSKRKSTQLMRRSPWRSSLVHFPSIFFGSILPPKKTVMFAAHPFWCWLMQAIMACSDILVPL